MKKILVILFVSMAFVTLCLGLTETKIYGMDRGVAISLAADTSFSPPARAIWVGATGNVKVDFATTGTAVIFTAVPAGTLLNISVKKVYSTANGTTASNLVALY